MRISGYMFELLGGILKLICFLLLPLVFAVLWSAVGLSVIASCLFYWLIQRGAATRVTSLIYLSPPTTALMGWAMFSEIMSWLAIAGMLLAMVGVAMAVRTK